MFQDISLLDLFSGTGNISYEFASRGCKDITSVDSHFGCIKYISKISEELNYNIHAIKADIFKYTKMPSRSFDIIFADPPYDFTLQQLEQMISQSFKNGLVSQEGVFILEHSKHTDVSGFERFSESTWDEKKYCRFALSGEAVWKNNFRDLNASINRMATLSIGGRITVELVEEEIERLEYLWNNGAESDTINILHEIFDEDRLKQIDIFDRVQLSEVIKVCKSCKNASEAGRALFAYSRTQKKNANDADRLAKYLNKFGLKWKDLG